MHQSPYIIGICGGSGSGKTKFTADLMQYFTTKEICHISQDDFYKPKAQQTQDSNGIENFDLPSAIDHTSFIDTIASLVQGKSTSIHRYTFNNPADKSNKIILSPAPIILIEGVFIYEMKAINKLFNLKLFIEADDAKKIIRRIKRDQIERGYDLNDVMYRYEHHVLPAYKQFVAPHKSKVDLVINNHDNYNNSFQIIKHHIQHILQNS